MQNIPMMLKGKVNILVILLPVISFIVPLLILYSLYSYSFEQAYQGRTLHLFFLWLVSLEIILNWEKLRKNKINKLGSVRTILLVIGLLFPTIYVIIGNYYGLNTAIENLAMQNNVQEHWALLIPLSFEYIVFAVLFGLIILLTYGIERLTDFSIPIFFSGIIGILFTIDNLYPWGRLTPLQVFVPATATLAAKVLNLMGYQTVFSIGRDPYYGYMPYLIARDPQNPFRIAAFGIAWPCAGIESFIIYTVTILLFLKKTNISRVHMVIYFAIGAVVTYFVNVLRVVSIFLIAMDNGYPSPPAQQFHDFYGPLYSIAWIISYPLIIIGSQILWDKIKVGNQIKFLRSFRLRMS